MSFLYPSKAVCSISESGFTIPLNAEGKILDTYLPIMPSV